MKNAKPLTCYFTSDELRSIGEIASREERPQSKVVQFAVRVLSHLYKEDPEQARRLAQLPGKSN